MDRGELVALVDGAPGRLGTLAATMRHWVHHERAAQARERLNELGDGQVVRGVMIGVDHGGAGPPISTEHVSRVWFASPNRWCIESDAHRSLDICDGRRHWQGVGGFVTERGSTPELAGSGQLGRLLVPGVVLGLVAFEDVSETERGGRPCIRAAGRPRQAGGNARRLLQLELQTFGVGALDHRFWFDAVHGFVVRHEGLLDGEPAVITELTELAVDDSISSERFAVPAGTTIETEAEERLRHLELMGVDTAGLDTSDPAAIRAALQAVGGGPRGRPSLQDRVRRHVAWGPPPEDEPLARAAVSAAFEAFGAASSDGRDLPNVQAGHGLAPLLAQARRRLPGATADNTRAIVDAVRFLAPDHAAVWFTIEVAGQRTPTVRERPGRAVRIDRRWLVEHATLAELLAFGGVQVPPPDQREPNT